MTVSHGQAKVRVILQGGRFPDAQCEVRLGEGGEPPQVFELHDLKIYGGGPGENTIIEQLTDFYQRREHRDPSGMWRYEYERNSRDDQ